MTTTPLTDQQLAAILLLKNQLAAAFEHMDAHQWGYDHGFCGTYGVDPETDSFVDAALAVMQPELDRLAAERDQARAELFEANARTSELEAELAAEKATTQSLRAELAELAELKLTPRERANRHVRALREAGDHEAACAAAEAFEASEAYDLNHPRV